MEDREQRHQEERERLAPVDADQKRDAELDPDLKDLEPREAEQAAIKGGPNDSAWIIAKP